MNSSIKALLVAVALIVVGCAVFGCSFLAAEGNLDTLSGTKMITLQETVTGEFTNIRLDVASADVQLHLSEDGSCYFKGQTNETMPYSALVENGTLVIRQEDQRKWYQYIGIFIRPSTLEIYLPTQAYDQSLIEADTGNVTVGKELSFETADISTSTGNLNISCPVTEDLNLHCSTGHIDLHNISPKTVNAAVSTGNMNISNIACDSFSIRTSTGHCRLENVTVAENLVAVSGTGDKHLTNVTCGSLNTKASTGDTELTNVIVSGDAKLESNTGDLHFDRFDAANITMSTSSGNVKGTLLSEKIFFVDTDTGSVNVPLSTSGGTCVITTDTGNVDIAITP